MPVGICRLCGEERELTFEHVPPRSAFNAERVQVGRPDIVDGEGLVTTPGRFQQRGAGDYYLCAQCNNLLGRQYVPAYLRFVSLLAGALSQVGEFEDVNDRDEPTHFRCRLESTDEAQLEVFPGRVVKQVVAMMLCVAMPGFANKREDLRRYVLDRDSTFLPGDVHVGFCFYLGNQARFGGPWAQMDIANGTMTVAIEVAFPPMAWLMTLSGAALPAGLADVTEYAASGHDYEMRTLEVEALVGFGTTLFPGDYRTGEQLRQHLARQEAEEE